MNTTLGDLAQSFMLQRRGAALKNDIHRLTQELSTGRVADTKSVLAGNFSYLSDIERDVRVLEGYKVATTEAAQFTETVQNILDGIQTNSSDLSDTMLLISTSAVETVLPQVEADSRANLANLVSSLNVDFGGRSLFAGAATDTAPLVSEEAILTGLISAVAGQTTASDIFAAAQAWFDNPAGFRAAVYQGSDNALSPFVLSDQDRLNIDIRADNPVLRNLMMNTAIGVIASDPSLALDVAVQRAVIAQAGQNLLGSQDQMTKMRAEVGFSQSRIEDVRARNAVEATSLEFARSALLAADPYETATKLEEVQFRLQGLYSVTVRLSELSLLNFIR
ncbi:flagellin [Pseudosulfitobacter sp. DSM 107133]|uniref:flagellin n=1 Tax=Pseudosulfitobacter sp. DSM 107133 TaxID=2883100 RepID=UPI000DF249B6|nr:flagellin [Pseudosulfitobacter sp. DSM 107133]UOA28800.1 hypothetical protein DSM107133_03558 [Pseudosulfitobacter sp. DSM 107133]